MSKTAKVRINDEANVVIVGLDDDHIDYLHNKFSVYAPNYFFHPKFKLGQWSGKIHYFHKTGKTYLYLLDDILPKVKALGYDLVLEDLRKSDFHAPDPIDENYFSNIEHSATGKPTILRQHQVEAINAMLPYGNGVIHASTGSGKAQPLTSKILTPSGWKTMGEIQCGDLVITPKNKHVSVLGVFPQGLKNIYEITFHDGSKTKCCAEHLWGAYVPKYKYASKSVYQTIQTSDIMLFLEERKQGIRTFGNITIPLCEPIQFPEQQLPIDPYLVGALIGDGGLRTTGIVFSNKDKDVLKRVERELSLIDMKMKFIDKSNCDYRLIRNNRSRTVIPESSILVQNLKQLQLLGKYSSEKFIPLLYKNASIEQRRELLRGLLDTDGTVGTKAIVSFTTTSLQLAIDVQDVVRSLGGTCTRSIRHPTFKYKDQTKQGQVAYECFVKFSNTDELFSSSLKQNRCRKQHGNGRITLGRRVKSVELVSNELAQCILIDDPDHLYITDDYIVTHNTIICASICDLYGKHAIKTITIVPSQDLIAQTKADYIHYNLDTGEYSGKEKTLNHQHVVSTWQALKNNPKIILMFQLVIVDEVHLAKGNVLQKILLEHSASIPHRIGLTGTIPKEKADQMAVQIAVGPVRYHVGAAHLIDLKILANLNISILQLEEDFTRSYNEYVIEHKAMIDQMTSQGRMVAHSEGTDKPRTYIQFKDEYFADFEGEKNFLHNKPARLETIAGFLEQKRDMKKGNVLCLVDRIDFGRQLAALIPDAILVNGKDIKQKDRKHVYKMFEDQDNLIVIATVHIAGTGLNIPRIFNLVFVDIGKSFTRVIQSIGRGLRVSEDKTHVNVTDICSDLKYSKRHVAERIRYYAEAKYPHKKTKIAYSENVNEL